MSEGVFSSTDLNQLQHQLEVWRQRQTGRPRLPMAVWSAAAKLAGTHGVSAVSRSLRIGFAKLREQTQAVVSASPGRSPFVELRLEVPPRSNSAVGSVELIDGPDRRLRLETGHDPTLWLAVAKAFWRSKA